MCQIANTIVTSSTREAGLPRKIHTLGGATSTTETATLKAGGAAETGEAGDGST